jgi:hypothetical protein
MVKINMIGPSHGTAELRLIESLRPTARLHTYHVFVPINSDAGGPRRYTFLRASGSISKARLPAGTCIYKKLWPPLRRVHGLRDFLEWPGGPLCSKSREYSPGSRYSDIFFAYTPSLHCLGGSKHTVNIQHINCLKCLHKPSLLLHDYYHVCLTSVQA